MADNMRLMDDNQPFLAFPLLILFINRLTPWNTFDVRVLRGRQANMMSMRQSYKNEQSKQ